MAEPLDEHENLLRARKHLEVVRSTLTNIIEEGLQHKNWAVLAHEIMKHRVCDLGFSACDLFESGCIVPSAVLTRSLLETVAGMVVMTRTVLFEGRWSPESETAASGFLYGGRLPNSLDRATNILTHIDRADRENGGLRDLYDRLSEVSHPNAFGMSGSYLDLDGVVQGNATIGRQRLAAHLVSVALRICAARAAESTLTFGKCDPD